MPRLVPVRALAIAIAVLAAAPAAAQTPPERARSIAVTGRADVAAAPDVATVTMGVVSEAETAAAALDANNEAVRGLLAQLKEEGIEPRDLQTAGFSVSPQYFYPPRPENGSEAPPRIVGYSVSNTVTARLRALDRLGSVLDAAVRAGANQINGIAFEVSEADALADAARKAAFDNARRKAELYAAAAGATLGPVLSVREGGDRAMPPMPHAMRVEMAKADSVPVETGEQTLQVEVEVTWGLAE